MAGIFKRIVLVLVLGTTLLVLTTMLALESSGVVIARTQASGSAVSRETHIWFVKKGDQLYLEAGNPNNPWVQDLQSGSTLHLRNEGLDGRYKYTLHTNGRHNEIRTLMREKYGWRDWWISILFDTTQSYLIEASIIEDD